MLRWMESFDYLTDEGELAHRWDSTTGYLDQRQPGRTGINAMRCQGQPALEKVFDPQQTWIIGWAFKIVGYANCELLRVSDKAVPTVHWGIFLDEDRLLSIQRYVRPQETTHATYSTPLQTDTWYHLECKVKIADAGEFEIKLNGTTILSGTGDLQVGTTSVADAVGFGGSASIIVDDIHICDLSGAQNNDFLGDCRVHALLPDGAGTHTDWTPSAGANYECVDEPTPNDDIDYVTSATAGHKDSYDMAPLSLSGLIAGLTAMAYARKDDVGSHSARVLARVNGADYVGDAKAMADTYLYVEKTWELNPDDSAAWEVADVNAAEFGAEVVT